MAKNTTGNGKGTTKSLSAEEHRMRKQASQARKKHNGAKGVHTGSLFADIADDRRAKRTERKEIRELNAETAQAQSDEALAIIGRMRMSHSCRMVAVFVATAFTHVQRSGRNSRTVVAREYTEKRFNSLHLEGRKFTDAQLSKGLQIGAHALRLAGQRVNQAPVKELVSA